MSRILPALWLCTIVSIAAAQQTEFNRYFSDRTLRVDLYHSGKAGDEQYALDCARVEGPWPGSRVNLIDTLNLGQYSVRVYDRGTGAMIYSRGYSTIFDEWETTGEAGGGIRRTFSETVPIWVNLFNRPGYLSTLILNEGSPDASVSVHTLENGWVEKTTVFTFDYSYREIPSEIFLYLDPKYVRESAGCFD